MFFRIFEGNHNIDEKNTNHIISPFPKKYVIIRQIAIFFIDLARYIKFLSYFCVNKTH